MSYTQQLHQLQQTDSRIDAIKKRLREIAANLVESEALKSDRIALKQAETTYHQCQAVMTDLDLEVEGVQKKIALN